MVEHNHSNVCLHEDQIQKQSRKITELETRADYKDKRIDDLEKKMDKMDKKLDDITEALNEIKMQSKTDDGQLELRLTKIETQLATMKEQQKKDRDDNQKRLTTYLTVVGLALTALTIILNYIH